MKNYYEILEVNPKASFEIIEKAYHTLVKKYHPDMQENEIEKMRSEQILKDLNEAYYVLSNVSLREQYDKELYEQNIRQQTRQNKIEQQVNNVQEQEPFLNSFKNSKKKKQKEVKNNNQNNNYEVGTLSGIIAIIERLFQDRPDISKIKKAKKKDILIFLLAVLIVLVFCVILWFIPFTNTFIRQILFMK
mgnify:CR=1 FL=1